MTLHYDIILTLWRVTKTIADKETYLSILYTPAPDIYD